MSATTATIASVSSTFANIESILGCTKINATTGTRLTMVAPHDVA